MSTRSYFPPRRVEHDQFGEDNGGDIAGILFCPRGGYVNDPQLAARNLADAARRRGAEFRWRARVAGIDRRSRGASVAGVTLEDGSSIEAPIVINAAGPHSQAIHDLAFQGASGPADDSKVSAKPMKVEVAYVQEPPGARADETLPVIADIDVGVYYRPQLGGQVLIGSVEPQCDELHFLSHADEMQPGLTDEWNELVYRAALRLPTLKVPNTASGLVALYDSTPDFTPIYDKTSLGGLYSIRGTSGNQFKNAPVVGKICATLVDGVENGRDHDVEPLSLPLERASGTLNLGIYSRLRGKQASTGSVLG